MEMNKLKEVYTLAFFLTLVQDITPWNRHQARVSWAAIMAINKLKAGMYIDFLPHTNAGSDTLDPPPGARQLRSDLSPARVGARFIAPVVQHMSFLHRRQKPAYFVNDHYRLKVGARFTCAPQGIAPVLQPLHLLLRRRKPAYCVDTFYRLNVGARLFC